LLNFLFLLLSLIPMFRSNARRLTSSHRRLPHTALACRPLEQVPHALKARGYDFMRLEQNRWVRVYETQQCKSMLPSRLVKGLTSDIRTLCLSSNGPYLTLIAVPIITTIPL
jgi:hypothetical protein